MSDPALNVTVEPVTIQNWEEVIKIDLEPEQWDNLDPPSALHALCEVQFWPTAKAYAIKASEDIVGMVIYGPRSTRPDQWFIAIMMVDRNHQRQGYGRAAIELVLEDIKKDPTAESVAINYRPHNKVAASVYASAGFIPVGEWEGDVLAERTLRNQNAPARRDASPTAASTASSVAR